MRAALLVPLATALLLGAPSPASAETWRQDGFTVRTSVDGRDRCIEVVGVGRNCSSAREQAGAGIEGHVIADPAAPRLGRYVIAFNAGDNARRVTVRWPGHRRTITRLRRFGAFLLVLPAAVRSRDVAIQIRYRHTTSGDTRPAPLTAVERSQKVAVRFAAPATGVPAALLTYTDREGARCVDVGDLVDGRYGLLAGGLFLEGLFGNDERCTSEPPAPVHAALTGISGRPWRVLAGFARSDVAFVEARVGTDPPVTAEPAVLPGRPYAIVLTTLGDVTTTAVLADGTRVTLPTEQTF